MFDWVAYLAQHDETLLNSSEGRRELCRYDPLLFALVYLRDSLSSDDTGNEISFNAFHLELAESAKQWARRGLRPRQIRDAWIAPRECGKSTWIFKILPVWALAYQHRKYVIAFGDTPKTVNKHMSSVKRQFDTNRLLRKDFPELVAPMKRITGVTEADNRQLFVSKSGVAFEVSSIDSSVIGANINGNRPDLLIFDDVEPDPSNYSMYLKEQRLDSIQTAFYLGPKAIVQMVGTVHMAGSVMDDLVRQVHEGSATAPKWVREENIQTHYFPAIVTNDDGSESSIWPEKWLMSDFNGELDGGLRWRDTSKFQVEMMNRAVSTDGAYWSDSDFRQGTVEPVNKRLISVDPAVTTNKNSDFTGIAVIGYSSLEQKAVVEYSAAVKLGPYELKALILKLADRFNARMVYVETNQGGDWVVELLNPMPPGIAVRQVKQSVKKEIRWTQAVDYWQRGWVLHDGPQPAFEQQAVAVPRSANDDVVDAVTSGVHYYLGERKKIRSGRRDRQYAYV